MHNLLMLNLLNFQIIFFLYWKLKYVQFLLNKKKFFISTYINWHWERRTRYPIKITPSYFNLPWCLNLIRIYLNMGPLLFHQLIIIKFCGILLIKWESFVLTLAWSFVFGECKPFLYFMFLDLVSRILDRLVKCKRHCSIYCCLNWF